MPSSLLLPPTPMKVPAPRPRNTSVSQGEAQERCKRFWWLERVAKVRPPQKHHFKVGSRLHDVAERVVQGQPQIYTPGWDTGLKPDEAGWLQSSIARGRELGLLDAEPGVYTEWPLVLLVGDEHLDARGIPLVGLSRVSTAEDDPERRVILPPESLIDGRPLPPNWDRLPHLVGFIDWYRPHPAKVRDHKSAKNRRYGKKQRDIRESLQMLVYPCLPFAQFPEVDEVDAGYNVFLKDRHAPHPVYAVSDQVTIDDSRARWRSFIDLTTECTQLRETFPRIGSETNPGRAANWIHVPGAVDVYRHDPKEIKARCDAFGGCPYQDLCFGRCNDEQLVIRLDGEVARAATPPSLPSKPAVTMPGLLPPLENTMPFGTPAAAAAPTLAPGQDVFVAEPDNQTDQYKARILEVDAVHELYRVGFWPNPSIEPDFGALPAAYTAQLPAEALATASLPGRQNPASYEEALRAAGMEAPDWAPAVTPTTGLLPGQADVRDQISEAEQMPQRSVEEVIKAHLHWIGHDIHIQASEGRANAFRGRCTNVDAGGMHLEGFESPVSWDWVGSVVAKNEEPIPGDEKDKARVTKKKHLESLDFTGAIQHIEEIIAKAKAKNSPSIGKRDIAKIEEYLAVAKDQQPEPAVAPRQASSVDHLIEDLFRDERFTNGIAEIVRRVAPAAPTY